MKSLKIGIIGSGSWATAIAKIASDNGNSFAWWVRQEANIQYFKNRHHNPHYLRNAYFDVSRIQFSADIKEVIAASDVLVMAVPSMHIASCLEKLTTKDLEGKKIVSAIKGVLPIHNILLHQYLEKKFQFPLNNYFTLLGPSHAEEVATEQLSYLTFSGLDQTFTKRIADCFQSEYINTIVNGDVVGVQYAGVVKNIYALGAGIAHGLEYGDNFLSVYIANCANEMKFLLESIQHKGGLESDGVNYYASVYLGDLLVTCYSLHSRNRTFGNMIGKGYSVKAAELELNMVAEGYNASKCIMNINKELNLSLPLIQAVYSILWEAACPNKTFKELEQILV